MTTLQLKIVKQDTYRKSKVLAPASSKDRELFIHLYPDFKWYQTEKDFSKEDLERLAQLCEAHNWILNISGKKK